ncbi:MAG: efflux RND transporter periplasmic adaptor subunit [Longimicrobiales bacterium]
MKRVLKVLVVVVILAGAGFAAYWRISTHDSENATTTAATNASGGDAGAAADQFSTDMPIPVEGAQVVKQDLILEVNASGQAVSVRSTVLQAQVAGLIVDVPVRENLAVSAGFPLVRIDTVDAALDLAEARANLDRAMQDFRRNTLGDDRITDPTIRAERERAARITAGIDGAEVAVKRAELNLSRTRVTAPFPGRVASVKIVPGQRVNVGDELLTVVDLDPIRLEVQVNESEVGYLTAGGRARIEFSAFPDETFEGRIATINPIADPVTRQAKVTVMVANPGARILPGFFADVTLDAQHLPDRVLVPRSAILERDVDRRQLVFVFDGEGTTGVAEWRYVQTGLGNSQLVEVLQDPDPATGAKTVAPGEIVLVDGHYSLSHGARITLVENAAAAGGRPR